MLKKRIDNLKKEIDSDLKISSTNLYNSQK